MNENAAPQVAVARLLEQGDGAAAHRRDPARPLQGFCLVSGDGDSYRVSIYVENSRSDAPGCAACLLTGDQAVPVGNLSGWASWEGSAACLREMQGVSLTADARIRIVMGEAGETMLEGPLVWLHGAPEAPAPAAVADEPEAEGALLSQEAHVAAVAGVAELEVELTGEAEAEMGADDGPVPSAVELHSAVEAPLSVGVGAVASSAPGTAFPLAPGYEAMADLYATPEAPPAAEAADTVPEQAPAGLAAPEPVGAGAAQAAPAGDVQKAAGPVRIPLESRHPRAPRASGTAVVDLATGGLTVALRGLPSPMLMGRDPRAGEPYGAYRVWLTGQNNRLRTPVGLCTRVWGENFRLQAEGLNLRQYDTIVVAVAERDGEHPNPAAPQVVVGSFRAG